MCIKIVNSYEEIPYNINIPLEKQLRQSDQIIVNYEPFDKSISPFLADVERIVNTGIDTKLNIRVVHNDDIFGFKMNQKMKKATNDMAVNEIIKLMALTQCVTDKKLEELAKECKGIGCNE